MTSVIFMMMLVSMTSCSGVKTGRLLGFDASVKNSLFEINIDTGEAKDLFQFSNDVSEGGLATGPDGALYAAFAGGNSNLVIIDPVNGEVTYIGPIGFEDVSGLAFGPDGTLFGFDESGPITQLIEIDTETGKGSAIGPGPINGNGLAFAPDGTLYLVSTPGLESRLYSVNPRTGEATEIGTFGNGLDGASGLEVIGEILYADAHSDDGPPYDLLVTLDRRTGEASLVGGYCSDGCKDGPSMAGLAFLPGPGDGDRDGDVDGDDVAFFEECFGDLNEPEKSPYCAFLDADKDGDLDCDDWEAFIPNWTEKTEPPTFEPCDGPLPCDGDANGDGVVDPLDTGYIMARFGCEVGTGDAKCDAADVNVDSVVDPLDAGYALARFGICM